VSLHRTIQRRLAKLEAGIEVSNPQQEHCDILAEALSKMAVEDVRLPRHIARMQATGITVEPTPEILAVVKRANALCADALAEHKASGAKARATW
jgi:hypothetical protein